MSRLALLSLSEMASFSRAVASSRSGVVSGPSRLVARIVLAWASASMMSRTTLEPRASISSPAV